MERAPAHPRRSQIAIERGPFCKAAMQNASKKRKKSKNSQKKGTNFSRENLALQRGSGTGLDV